MKKILISILLFLFLSSFVSAETVPEGGVTYYNFSSTTDLWGSNDGTNSGATSILSYPTYNTTGNSSPNSYNFDGTNDRISIPSFGLFDGSKDFSIGFWLNSDDITTDYLNQFNFVKENDILIQQQAANGLISFRRNGNGTWGDGATVTLSSTSTWYHIVFTYSSTTGFKAYLDGTDQATGSGAVAISSTLGGVDNYIGGDHDNARRYYDGQMDEVKIYNKTLTISEITKLYNDGNISSSSDVVTNLTITSVMLTSETPNQNVTTVRGNTTDSTPTFNISTVDAANCSINATTICSTTNSTTHICTQPVASALSDGDVSVYFNCSDSTNSTSNKTINLRVDTTPPSLVFNSPASQTFLDDFNQTFSFTCSDSVEVANMSIFVNGTLNVTNTTVVNNSAWSHDITFTEYTNYTVNGVCYDWVGNSDTTANRTYEFSSVAPEVTFNSPESQTYSVSAVSGSSVASPGTMADDDTVGVRQWYNPENAKTSDGTYATATTSLSTFTFSNYLKATNFSFSIPSGVTIAGIKVEIEKRQDDATAYDEEVKIVKSDGSIGTENKAVTDVNWPTTDTYFSYGSSSDKWSETWTAADINDVDFGVVISATYKKISGGAATVNVDHIRITVYYDEIAEQTANVTAVDENTISNVSLYINSTLNQTNSSYTNNTVWGAKWTPSAYTNYTAYFRACDEAGVCVNSATHWFNFIQESVDTCTYAGSGDWNITISDNCTLSSDTDIGSNTIKITGDNGKLIINSSIFAKEIHIEPDNFDGGFLIGMLSGSIFSAQP